MEHTAALRKRIGELTGMAGETQAVERKILEAAEQRLEVVRGDLEKLRPRVVLDDGAAEEYRNLTTESGRLQTVIATARAAL